MSDLPVIKSKRTRRSPYAEIDINTQKQCKRCLVWKPFIDFEQRGKTFIYCNKCREYKRARYQAKKLPTNTNTPQEITV